MGLGHAEPPHRRAGGEVGLTQEPHGVVVGDVVYGGHSRHHGIEHLHM